MNALTERHAERAWTTTSITSVVVFELPCSMRETPRMVPLSSKRGDFNARSAT
jgi:hypothetical protein